MLGKIASLAHRKKKELAILDKFSTVRA
jgi:hypothetical protein